MALSGSAEAGPEVEARSLTSALGLLLPLKMAALHYSPRPDVHHFLSDVLLFLLTSPRGLPEAAPGQRKVFVLEAILKNALPQLLQPPKSVQKHVPFSHAIWRLMRQHASFSRSL